MPAYGANGYESRVEDPKVSWGGTVDESNSYGIPVVESKEKGGRHDRPETVDNHDESALELHDPPQITGCQRLQEEGRVLLEWRSLLVEQLPLPAFD